MRIRGIMPAFGKQRGAEGAGNKMIGIPYGKKFRIDTGEALVKIAAEHGRGCVEPVSRFAKQIKQAISQSPNKNS